MLIRNFIEKNRGGNALEPKVKELLKGLGLSVPKGIFVPDKALISDFNSQLSTLSFPLVAKVSSSKIISKNEVNGVKLGIKNDKELNKAVAELGLIQDAEGILIEEMAQAGTEVIVGGAIDKQFGPVVMFGIGGVFVELFKDTAFALAPLKEEGALWLIQQVKGYRLIEGYRGNPPLDKNELIKVILAVSDIISTGDVKEIDLNPVVLYPKGAIVLDAKMKISSK